MSALNEPQAGNITVHSLVVEFSCVLIFTCDEVRGRRSTDDIRPYKILEIVALEARKQWFIG